MIKSEALAELCLMASKSPYIAFDTEFSRLKGYYYPIPSLIQFSFDGEKAYLCDLYDKELDWTPLVNLLSNDKILKVFHAVKQDLDVLQKAFQITPNKLFDLQIAARFLNYSNPSYNRLAKDFLSLDLDKKMQFSDWTRRPLTSEQLEYAASDVTHLYRLFPKITEALGKKSAWSHEEMARLVVKENKADFLLDKMSLAILMEKGKTLTPKALWYLKQILVWRENKILERNLLREKILPTPLIKKILYQLLLEQPPLIKSKDLKDLQATVEILPEDFMAEEALLETLLIKKDLLLSNSKYYKSLKDLAGKISQKLSLDKSLLASKSDLLHIAAKKSLPPKFQTGWRYEVFGVKIEKFFKFLSHH
jgi:ribonuclease D